MKLEDIADAAEFIRKFRQWEGFVGESGCQEWTGATVEGGYGYLWTRTKDGRQRRVYAHRARFLIENGEIGDKVSVCHKCNNPPCTRVGPRHIYEGNQSTNGKDAVEAGKGPKSLGLTHCPHGHPYTSENTYVSSSGYRHCMICRKDSHSRLRRSKAHMQGVQYGVVERDEKGRWRRKYSLGWDATLEEIGASLPEVYDDAH